MSENYDEKDLEKLIFKEGLAGGAIEPSEKFWNKAYEGILERNNHAQINRASRWWKGAFFIAGAAALLLGYYAFYVGTELADIKQQLTAIKTTEKNIVQQNATRNSVATTSEGNSGNQNISQTGINKNIPQTTTGAAFVSVNKTTDNTFGEKIIRRTNTYSANSPVHISIPITPQVTHETSNSNNAKLLASNTPSITNSPASNENNNASTPTQITNNAAPPSPVNGLHSAASPNPSTSPQISKTELSGKKTDSAFARINLDSSNALYLSRKPVTFKNILSKISVSAFYAPGMTNDFLHDKDNDPTKTITASTLKTRQDGDGTYAIGLRLTYDISNKWSIFTGCYYSLYSYNIKPTIVYAQQQENGLLGYSITTSSGTVFLPYTAGTTHIGDSIKVKGSSSRSYLSIPLQAKYKLATGRKLGLYITGGFSINIADYKETQISWENTALQEGDLSVQDIYGLNTVHFSYNLGLGANYIILRGLSIYAEPYVDGSFTSINNNTPVTTYPYFFGLALGVTYHF